MACLMNICANIQVSWSLAHECRSRSPADRRGRQLFSTSEEVGGADCNLRTHSGVPVSIRHCNYGGGRGKTTVGNDSLSGWGDKTEINNDNSTNVVEGYNNNSDGGSCRDAGCISNVGEGASANGDGTNGKFPSSSWQLRRHFPPNALVPRAPPTCIFSGALAPAKPTAAQATPTQRSTRPSDSIFLAEGASAADAGTLQPTDAPATRPRASETKPLSQIATESGTPARARGRRRPHTVSTGLHDLGLAWARPENTSLETGQGGSPVPCLRKEATGDEAAATDTEEGKAAAIRHADGGGTGCLKKTPRGTQGDWGAPRMQADGVLVLGLTAEVIKSPGVALDRSGRVAVVGKVMREGGRKMLIP